MTTLTPREPYSKEELETLYPKGLQLQLVQIVRVFYCMHHRFCSSMQMSKAVSTPYTNCVFRDSCCGMVLLTVTAGCYLQRPVGLSKC